MSQIEQSQIVLNEVFSSLNLPIVVIRQPMAKGDNTLRFMHVTENGEETRLRNFEPAQPVAVKLHDALNDIGLTFLKEARVPEHGSDLTLLVNPDAGFLAQNRGALTKALTASFTVR